MKLSLLIIAAFYVAVITAAPRPVGTTCGTSDNDPELGCQGDFTKPVLVKRYPLVNKHAVNRRRQDGFRNRRNRNNNNNNNTNNGNNNNNSDPTTTDEPTATPAADESNGDNGNENDDSDNNTGDDTPSSTTESSTSIATAAPVATDTPATDNGNTAADPTATIDANFSKMARFCKQVGLGNAISDGTQKQTQTCSQTIQGSIPAFEQMVSTIISSPASGANLPRKTDITVQVRTLNMDLGFFEDPVTRYYATPQTLNSDGKIEGHQHVVLQKISSTDAALDPRTESLAFFKGLDTRDNNGVLTTTITAVSVADPGQYRLCTITGTRGHQPVIMPVARRGSQDDCIRFNIV